MDCKAHINRGQEAWVIRRTSRCLDQGGGKCGEKIAELVGVTSIVDEGKALLGISRRM